LVTAIAGAITTIWGAKRSAREAKDKADEDCLTRLRDARAEAEQLASELYQKKMDEYKMLERADAAYRNSQRDVRPEEK